MARVRSAAPSTEGVVRKAILNAQAEALIAIACTMPSTQQPSANPISFM